MMLKQIKLKVSLYLALALSPALLLVPFLVVQYQRDHLQVEIAQHVVQTAEVVVRSTRHAMLLN